MLERPLRILAVVCSLVVAASFALFATGELDSASHQSRIGVSDAAAAEQIRAASIRAAESPDGEASGVERAIEDAGDALLAPFAGIAESSGDVWVREGVPAALGLLLYGFGLGFLARYARGRA